MNQRSCQITKTQSTLGGAPIRYFWSSYNSDKLQLCSNSLYLFLTIHVSNAQKNDALISPPRQVYLPWDESSLMERLSALFPLGGLLGAGSHPSLCLLQRPFALLSTSFLYSPNHNIFLKKIYLSYR